MTALSWMDTNAIIMATTATAAAATSEDEQFLKAYRRIRAVRTRPTTVAANEFFADQDWQSLPKRLDRLCRVLQQWDAPNENAELSTSLSSDAAESRRLAMTAAILASAPPNFQSNFQSLFTHSLQQRQVNWKEDSMEEDDENEQHFFESLRTLGWIRRGACLTEPLGRAIHDMILSQVKNTIQGEFEEESLFESVQAWKDAVVEPWVRDIMGPDDFINDNWSERLSYCTAECFCLVRMDALFDMIADYPDSQPAVLELQQVLEMTGMHSQLGETLQQSLKKRLIHPGANTSQIIDVYINTIKVLREIDPSDRLLESVTDPVRAYLRGRTDTVRCIITSLTDEEAGGDLYEELRRQDARPLEHAQLDSDDETEPPDLDWVPPPPLSKQRHSFLGTSSKGGDILSMLVSIYGSKELFVNEYRLMLADKLLANLDYNTDKELHTLELLKLRFGEMSMRQCEIMIKDIDNSKRTVHSMHEMIQAKRKTKDNPVVDAAIVSHIFWPALQKEQLKHHPRIQKELDEFSEEYGKLKNPRRLVWLNQLGNVDLELDVVQDGEIVTRSFSCSPLLATLISHFEDKEQWTAEDLSNETGIAEHIVQRKMQFWIHNRVVKVATLQEGETCYELTTMEAWKDVENGSDRGVVAMHDDDGHDGLAVSRGAHEEEEVEVYESFITVMLTNRQLPLDSIHTMLQMMVTSGSDHKYNKTPQQLSVFLQQLCKQDKIECGPDGMYKLVKKDK